MYSFHWPWQWWWRKPVPKPTPKPTPTPPPVPTPTPTPTKRPALPPELKGDDGGIICPIKPAWATAAVTLGSCIQLKDYAPGQVELAWLELESLDSGGNVLAVTRTLGKDVWGELHTRYPMWGVGSTNKIERWEPRELNGTTLLIHPNLRSDKIWHFWSFKPTLPPGAVSVRVSARVKITGGALFSIGSDWWRSANDTSSQWGPCHSTDPRTTNSDGPQSRWYSLENSDWQTIIVLPYTTGSIV